MPDIPKSSEGKLSFVARIMGVLGLATALSCSPDINEGSPQKDSDKSNAEGRGDTKRKGSFVSRVREIIESDCLTHTENLPDEEPNEWGQLVNRRLTHLSPGCPEGAKYLYYEIVEELKSRKVKNSGPASCVFWSVVESESGQGVEEVYFNVTLQSNGLLVLDNNKGRTTLSPDGKIEGGASEFLLEAATLDRLEYDIIRPDGEKKSVIEYRKPKLEGSYFQWCESSY